MPVFVYVCTHDAAHGWITGGKLDRIAMSPLCGYLRFLNFIDLRFKKSLDSPSAQDNTDATHRSLLMKIRFDSQQIYQAVPLGRAHIQGKLIGFSIKPEEGGGGGGGGGGGWGPMYGSASRCN